MQFLGTVFEQLGTPDREVRRARRHRANRQRARLRQRHSGGTRHD